MTRWATPASRLGVVLGALLIALAAFGPWLTRNRPSEQFAEAVYAPPMRPHIIERADDGSTRLRWPFVYPLRLEFRLEHRYAEDRARPMPLRLFHGGALLSVDLLHGSPWFPLGADALGRDQLARLARARACRWAWRSAPRSERSSSARRPAASPDLPEASSTMA